MTKATQEQKWGYFFCFPVNRIILSILRYMALYVCWHSPGKPYSPRVYDNFLYCPQANYWGLGFPSTKMQWTSQLENLRTPQLENMIVEEMQDTAVGELENISMFYIFSMFSMVFNLCFPDSVIYKALLRISITFSDYFKPHKTTVSEAFGRWFTVE